MNAWLEPERLEQGYVIVLPGIEGRSFLNRGIAAGLVDGGVPYGIEIYDWTDGPLWAIYNLRSRKLHARQALILKEKILAYRAEHPGRPVYLVGHSGGGALSLLAAEGLPEGTGVTGIVMIVPAISPGFPLERALAHVEQGIWNYRSIGDIVYLGALTTLFGTVDGRHAPAAGAVGFARPADPRLQEIAFRLEMLRDWNTGGHLSCTNRAFIRKWIAPLLLTHSG
ncbi:Alpha/beta hydrolase family protein [Caulifigura coniformis]|uniref:Alpha/beta hydrolase family protein n=1 Tax=Caulifigura coniformis TaxID=2527983 RepID=A0A517SB12_9PLAN|nr:alpha/beta hydrolase [Caulifigura coniformis]QDT53305.1 Alpha/beta hydrolase family protein [Caulifigura coniformis]